MKKTIISIVLIISAVAIMLTGCGNKEVYTAKVYDIDGSLVQKITIDVQDREITVGVSDDNLIHFEYQESEKEKYEISIVDNEITVQLSIDREWTDFISIKSAKEYRKLIVKIPNSVIDDLQISTTNENIDISTLAVKGSMHISANGGNVALTSVEVGEGLSLSAKNGDIVGTVVGSYDVFNIKCRIKKGDCNLPLEKLDGVKSLAINCNNGDINIDFV